MSDLEIRRPCFRFFMSGLYFDDMKTHLQEDLLFVETFPSVLSAFDKSHAFFLQLMCYQSDQNRFLRTVLATTGIQGGILIYDTAKSLISDEIFESLSPATNDVTICNDDGVESVHDKGLNS